MRLKDVIHLFSFYLEFGFNSVIIGLGDNMKTTPEILEDLKKRNIRLTEQRRLIVELLDGRHLTLHEIHSGMRARGFTNLGTIYNNLDLLIAEKVVAEVYIKNRKHYDLVGSDLSIHDANSHMHLSCSINNKIVEIDDKDLFETIKNHPVFEGFDITKLQIVVEGSCPNYDPKTCRITSACHIDHLT